MDEGPPSQVAVSRLLLVFFFFPSSRRRVGQCMHTQTHVILSLLRLLEGWDGAEGADGGWIWANKGRCDCSASMALSVLMFTLHDYMLIFSTLRVSHFIFVLLFAHIYFWMGSVCGSSTSWQCKKTRMSRVNNKIRCHICFNIKHNKYIMRRFVWTEPPSALIAVSKAISVLCFVTLHLVTRHNYGSHWFFFFTLFWDLVSGWKNPKTLSLCSCFHSESAFFASYPHNVS